MFNISHVVFRHKSCLSIQERDIYDQRGIVFKDRQTRLTHKDGSFMRW